MLGRERFRLPNFLSVMAGLTNQHLRHDALNASKGGSEPQVVGRMNLQNLSCHSQKVKWAHCLVI